MADLNSSLSLSKSIDRIMDSKARQNYGDLDDICLTTKADFSCGTVDALRYSLRGQSSSLISYIHALFHRPMCQCSARCTGSLPMTETRLLWHW